MSHRVNRLGYQHFKGAKGVPRRRECTFGLLVQRFAYWWWSITHLVMAMLINGEQSHNLLTLIRANPHLEISRSHYTKFRCYQMYEQLTLHYVKRKLSYTSRNKRMKEYDTKYSSTFSSLQVRSNLCAVRKFSHTVQCRSSLEPLNLSFIESMVQFLELALDIKLKIQFPKSFHPWSVLEESKEHPP